MLFLCSSTASYNCGTSNNKGILFFYLFHFIVFYCLLIILLGTYMVCEDQSDLSKVRYNYPLPLLSLYLSSSFFLTFFSYFLTSQVQPVLLRNADHRHHQHSKQQRHPQGKCKGHSQDGLWIAGREERRGYYCFRLFV